MFIYIYGDREKRFDNESLGDVAVKGAKYRINISLSGTRELGPGGSMHNLQGIWAYTRTALGQRE
jgi:hypothetical protein